jgi:hypothetical protein
MCKLFLCKMLTFNTIYFYFCNNMIIYLKIVFDCFLYTYFIILNNVNKFKMKKFSGFPDDCSPEQLEKLE